MPAYILVSLELLEPFDEIQGALRVLILLEAHSPTNRNYRQRLKVFYYRPGHSHRLAIKCACIVHATKARMSQNSFVTSSLRPTAGRWRSPRLRRALELRPDDAVGHRRLGAHRGAEAAIDAGDDALAADDVGIAPDALRHEARMLDEVGGRIDDAGDQDLVVGNVDRLEILPFMLVARIGALEAERLRAAP